MACSHLRARAILIALVSILCTSPAQASPPDAAFSERAPLAQQTPPPGTAPPGTLPPGSTQPAPPTPDLPDAGDTSAPYSADTGDAGDTTPGQRTQPHVPGQPRPDRNSDAGDDTDVPDSGRFSIGEIISADLPDAGAPDDTDAPDARVAGCQSEGAQGSPWAISVVLLGFMVLHAAGLLGRRHVR
ncbi:hypothetical protein FRC98_19635 [Lujinxingia vulgaris]|uniref:Uncharacterized protein n=1 Tax=Lujinxingia vulgaris TaxID=2600176 RepID=A0A5C6X5U7_9DELT|nr:hypothetical protein [Lujinxingia vulgaris]TXD34070.1 hypothetical protein FRC98_19635 [Lujinxingia vulgaris]